MIIVVSSLICLFVGHFSISVHWEFPVLVCLGCRIFFGSYTTSSALSPNSNCCVNARERL